MGQLTSWLVLEHVVYPFNRVKVLRLLATDAAKLKKEPMSGSFLENTYESKHHCIRTKESKKIKEINVAHGKSVTPHQSVKYLLLVVSHVE